MKALLAVPRLPGTGFTGDRVRAAIHLAALREAGFEVHVVGGFRAGGAAPPLPGAAAVVGVPLGAASVAAGLARAAFRGWPLQSALAAGSWARALSRTAGPFDLAVVVLVRLWPAVSRLLPRSPVVLDYVDALALAARQAGSRDPSPWRRAYWRLEAPRLARWEREAASRASLLLATTPSDAAALPAGTEVLPNGVELLPRAEGPRGKIVAFSGRLPYRPNALAVRRLLDGVWPRVLERVPDAELHLGGADAPESLREEAAGSRVTVESPVDGMPAFLRRARVAVVPVSLGTGTPNKLFEALEASTPVVAVPEAVERSVLDGVRPPVSAAATDAQLAEAVVSYLLDADRARSDGDAGRRFVEEHADRRLVVSRLAGRYRAAVERR